MNSKKTKFITTILVLILAISSAIPVFAEDTVNGTSTDVTVTEQEEQTDEAQTDSSEVQTDSSEVQPSDDSNQTNQSTDEQTNSADEQSEDTDDALAESLIKDCKAYATGVNSLTIEWEYDDRVYIHYSYTDVDEYTTTLNQCYNLTNIPFGETVNLTLFTDDEHEQLNFSLNPSEEYTPVQVEDIKASYRKSYTTAQSYCSGLQVYSKSGEVISASNYSLVSKSITKVGKYDVTVQFNNKYENYEPMTFVLTVVPSAPKLYYAGATEQTSFSYTITTTNSSDFDSFIFEISQNSDYSNPIVKKFARNGSDTYVYKKITGMSKNTQYYIRARSKKIVNGETLYSDYTYDKVHTTQPAPTYSWNSVHVKNLVSLMKKNKSFSYTIKGYYNYNDFYNGFSRNLYDDYPQYVGRYNHVLRIKDGKVVLEYTLNSSKLSANIKLEKAINSIAKNANKKKGVKAKVRYINKMICKRCRYKHTSTCYTAYGCLVGHKAVCSGYAKAFRAIAVQCGIPNTYAYGPNHIWNKVYVGGRWLHVDVTWNDCTHSTKYLLKTTHR